MHAGHEHDLRAVGRPGGRRICALEARPGNQLVGERGVNADLRRQNAAAAGLRVTGERDARSVGRPARRERDGVQLRQLVLVFAVVIHGPDFLVAAAIADEGDLRAGDSRQAAGKSPDDFVGKLMREGADLRFGGLAAIHFSDHRRQGSVPDIVQPGLNLQVVAVDGKVAERQQLRRGGRAGPRLVVDFRGRRRASAAG